MLDYFLSSSTLYISSKHFKAACRLFILKIKSNSEREKKNLPLTNVFIHVEGFHIFEGEITAFVVFN